MKKAVSKQRRLEIAVKQHEDWLTSKGLHPVQLNKSKKRLPSLIPSYKVSKPENLPEVSNFIASSDTCAAKKGIWEVVRKNKESAETIEEIINKASRVAPAFNKGATQYLGTDPENFKHAGKKNAS